MEDSSWRPETLLLWAPVAALSAWWTLDAGGYRSTQWYPGGLVLLATLVIALVVRRRQRLRRSAFVALLAFAGYVAWSYLSITWADSPGPALEGSHKALLYLLAFALSLALPWSPRTLGLAVGVWVTIVTVAGVITTIRLGGDDALSQILAFRLSEPTSYQNANAALWTMAAMPAWVLAARRQTPVVVRSLLAGSSALLLSLAILTQSRGWLFTLPIILVVTLLLSGQRLRLLLFALPVALGILFSLTAVLAPYGAGSGSPAERAPAVEAALNHAAGQMALGAVLAAVAAMLLATLDSRVRPRPTVVRRASQALGLAAAVAAMAGAAAVVAATDGDPGGSISRAWEDFKDFKADDRATVSHLTAVGSSRYDFWRVAAELWSKRPIGGLGQDNFAQAYLVERETREEPRWVHSLQLRLLAHTGLVGFALMLTALAAAFVAAIRGAGRASRLVVAAALLPAADWIVHGSVDWLWEFPGLSVPALSLLGAAAVSREHDGATAPARGADTARRIPRGAALAAVAVGAVAALAAAVALATAWGAARDVQVASRGWPADPDAARKRLDRAMSLNPLDANAPLVAGVIALRTGQDGEALRHLRTAAERDPKNWLVRLELGLLRSNPSARASLADAQRLNPQEELVTEAIRRFGGPRPLTAGEVDRELRSRIEKRLARSRASGR